jgi:hypothetical protein
VRRRTRARRRRRRRIPHCYVTHTMYCKIAISQYVLENVLEYALEYVLEYGNILINNKPETTSWYLEHKPHKCWRANRLAGF